MNITKTQIGQFYVDEGINQVFKILSKDEDGVNVLYIVFDVGDPITIRNIKIANDYYYDLKSPNNLTKNKKQIILTKLFKLSENGIRNGIWM